MDNNVLAYRDTVLLAFVIREQITWNQDHGLPLLTLPAQYYELLRQISEYQTAIETVPNRRARIALCCRAVLGWSIPQTAEYMGISRGLAQALSKIALKQIEYAAEAHADRRSDAIADAPDTRTGIPSC